MSLSNRKGSSLFLEWDTAATGEYEEYRAAYNDKVPWFIDTNSPAGMTLLPSKDNAKQDTLIMLNYFLSIPTKVIK